VRAVPGITLLGMGKSQRMRGYMVGSVRKMSNPHHEKKKRGVIKYRTKAKKRKGGKVTKWAFPTNSQGAGDRKERRSFSSQ